MKKIIFFYLFVSTYLACSAMEKYECDLSSLISEEDVFDSFSNEYLYDACNNSNDYTEFYDVPLPAMTYGTHFANQYNNGIVYLSQAPVMMQSNNNDAQLNFDYPTHEQLQIAPIVEPLNDSNNQIVSKYEQKNCAPTLLISCIKPIKKNYAKHKATRVSELNCKYHPSRQILKDQIKQRRYDDFHDLINNRYTDALKKCCEIEFATISDLRKHIEEKHKKIAIAKLSHNVVEYTCNDVDCDDCPYKSPDAAVSHFLYKINPTIFDCNKCLTMLKSYTSFYRHYVFNCKAIKNLIKQ